MLLTGQCLLGQGKLNCYWISFKNKDKSEFSTQRPWEFLSPRSINRRIEEGISITEVDLPVSTEMKNQVREKVHKILYASRWLNAVNVVATESQIDSLKDVDFIKSIEYIGRFTRKKYFLRVSDREEPVQRQLQLSEDPYGYASEQITQMNGQFLHTLGFRGEGELIGVLDGGFTNVDIMPVLQNRDDSSRIFSSYDFIHGDQYAFESSTHGSTILSTMASDLAGYYVGTAPAASYACMKTENVRGEYRLEEYNWIGGIEKLDSLGGRIANASLGYTTFTDAKMNYSYEDLNGETSPASIAARYAYDRGILIFNSIGNSGNNPWKYMGVPSDSEYVFSVGGVDRNREHAAFSSIGPTADGRIKPDLSVLGQAVTAPSIYEFDLTIGNGTSYSSPILAGMAASLWSAFPTCEHQEIMTALRMSGSKYGDPDPVLGHGIPDILKAYGILSGLSYLNLSSMGLPFYILGDEDEIIVFGGLSDLNEVKISFTDILEREVNAENVEEFDSYYAGLKYVFAYDDWRILNLEFQGNIYHFHIR